MRIHSFDESCVALQLSGQRPGGSDQANAQRLEVCVVFTNKTGTVAALQMANRLASKLGASLQLVMPHEVPFRLPLTKPAVQVEFMERELRETADQACVEIDARIVLCRDRRRALQTVIRPGSLVLVGGRNRWWPTPEQKLAQSLTRAGHHVIFAESK